MARRLTTNSTSCRAGPALRVASRLACSDTLLLYDVHVVASLVCRAYSTRFDRRLAKLASLHQARWRCVPFAQICCGGPEQSQSLSALSREACTVPPIAPHPCTLSVGNVRYLWQTLYLYLANVIPLFDKRTFLWLSSPWRQRAAAMAGTTPRRGNHQRRCLSGWRVSIRCRNSGCFLCWRGLEVRWLGEAGWRLGGERCVGGSWRSLPWCTAILRKVTRSVHPLGAEAGRGGGGKWGTGRKSDRCHNCKRYQISE